MRDKWAIIYVPWIDLDSCVIGPIASRRYGTVSVFEPHRKFNTHTRFTFTLNVLFNVNVKRVCVCPKNVPSNEQ